MPSGLLIATLVWLERVDGPFTRAGFDSQSEDGLPPRTHSQATLGLVAGPQDVDDGSWRQVPLGDDDKRVVEKVGGLIGECAARQ